VKKFFIISLIVTAILAVSVLSIRIIFGGNEDTWICQSGAWVKHGNPSSPKPEGGCGPVIVEKAREQLEDSSLCYSPNGSSMTYAQAKEKAGLGCGDGNLEEYHFCNDTTGTWWIDFVPNSPKEGCNPACVVFVDTGGAEINWRCTGLIP
jgi:hypothetical protein